MDNEILDDIKKYAIEKLKNAYGCCGSAEGAKSVMLNSKDRKGNNIKITIKQVPE